MKILYVITKANWGGAQKYVHDLAAAAKERGDDVAVVTGEPGILTEKLASLHIRTIELPFRQHRTFIGDLLTFGSLFSLIRIFRDEKPDVVHVNSAKAGGLGSLAARVAHVPRIVFTAHGWEFNAPRSTGAKMGIRFFSWLTLLLAHKTIAVSEAIAHDVQAWPFVKKRLTVIHHGIACSRHLARERAQAALAPDITAAHWIGMVSELIPTKCVGDAIIAFASVALRYPDTVLVVIGEGRDRAHLERLILEHDLDGRVILVGFKDHAASLLNAFDLFLHTSSSEALGYAILEAGCASLPVVATRVGGIPEIIIDDSVGRLVPPHNPALLAVVLDSLLADPKRAHHLGEALKTRITEEFSTEKMLARTFATYS